MRANLLRTGTNLNSFAERVLEQVSPVILIQPQFGMCMRLCARNELGQLLQRFARTEGREGLGDLRQ